MKKILEAFLVIIIFYGVYSAFNQIAPMITPELSAFWIAVLSLIISLSLLLWYSGIIATGAKKELKTRVSRLEETISEKDQEIKSAQSFKDTLLTEAELVVDKTLE